MSISFSILSAIADIVLCSGNVQSLLTLQAVTTAWFLLSVAFGALAAWCLSPISPLAPLSEAELSSVFEVVVVPMILVRGSDGSRCLVS